MKLLSVNLSGPKPHTVAGKPKFTGIYKEPTGEPVYIGELGLEGDVQVDKKNHGGPDQAVYLYSEEDYTWFSKELGRELDPGTFGENLTLSSFGTDTVFIGDRFRIGEVLLEVSAPRIPCGTFAARMGDSGFVKCFKDAERPGVYARVLQEGKVQQGDTLTYERGDSDVSALEAFRLFYKKRPNISEIKRMLAAPIDMRGRKSYEADLAKLSA